MARSTLVFLHVAKTGGRTVDTVLRGTYGAGYVLAEPLREPRPVGTGGREFLLPTYGPDDYRWLRRRIPWLRAIGGHTLTLWSGLHEVEPVRYVAFLREPLARAASHYQFHVNTTPAPLDWEAWCAWPEHHDHQVRGHPGPRRLRRPARALRGIAAPAASTRGAGVALCLPAQQHRSQQRAGPLPAGRSTAL
jgi:hypothetical protein